MRQTIRAIQPVNDIETKHQIRSLGYNAIRNAVILAAHDPKIHVSVEELDADPYALNTPTGCVNLFSGDLKTSRPQDRHTRMTRVAPDFTRRPERFLRFLNDTFRDYPELIPYIQRLIGYSVLGKVTWHILPFLHGAGANGKTVLLETFQNVLGDYATTQPADFLLAHASDEHETVIARLSGQRLVVCSEVSPKAKFNEQRVKTLTGGERIAARFMRENHFTFTPTHHLWLVGNHEPKVEVGGNSLWRRIRKIPFLHSVPEEKQIEDFSGILADEEGPAILAWIIAGAQLQQKGLDEPLAVTRATKEYEEEEDQIGRFIRERIRFGGGKLVRIETKTFRKAYEEWCAETSEKPMAGGPSFGKELKARGVETLRSNGRVFYLNVTILNSDEETERPAQMKWLDK
jgi:P4 family phage/plasmid primase-like protien